MDKEYIEQILVEYGVAFTDCLADRLLKEFQAKEEINQSLLYENERLLKSVQEMKAEIETVTRFGNAYEPIEHGLLFDIIDKHMSWEDEE